MQDDKTRKVALIGGGLFIGRSMAELIKEERKRQEEVYIPPKMFTEISYYPPAKTFNKRFPRK